MMYFRRPQTPFVEQEGSQKPQSQWNIVASGHSGDDQEDVRSNGSSSAGGLDGGSFHKEVNGLVEEHPYAATTANTDLSNEEENGTTTDNDDNTDFDLATSLDKRLQLDIKDHPESVLLCGYFHEDVLDDRLTLSTYLPGVDARELRVYYGDCVLRIAGARAMYNLVQRFERSFGLDDRLVNTQDIQAVLNEGMLIIHVPLIQPPPPPVKIPIVEAMPIFHFVNRQEVFCLDIDVPGVQVKDLTVEYNNGTLRLLWERLEPAVGKNQKTMMRFERVIPINTLQIDTHKFTAHLDHHSKPVGILTITAPYKVKCATRPIQVQTTKEEM